MNHLRLIVGTSMGCMHAWMWGGTYPDFMEALMPLVLDPKRRVPDPDDYVYVVESSCDYDPRPDLPKLKAAVYAVNFADDPVNPPELGIFQNEAAKWPTVKYVVVPATAETHGHSTHSWPLFWRQYLAELLERSGAGQAASTR